MSTTHKAVHRVMRSLAWEIHAIRSMAWALIALRLSCASGSRARAPRPINSRQRSCGANNAIKSCRRPSSRRWWPFSLPSLQDLDSINRFQGGRRENTTITPQVDQTRAIVSGAWLSTWGPAICASISRRHVQALGACSCLAVARRKFDRFFLGRYRPADRTKTAQVWPSHAHYLPRGSVAVGGSGG